MYCVQPAQQNGLVAVYLYQKYTGAAQPSGKSWRPCASAPEDAAVVPDDLSVSRLERKSRLRPRASTFAIADAYRRIS